MAVLIVGFMLIFKSLIVNLAAKEFTYKNDNKYYFYIIFHL